MDRAINDLDEGCCCSAKAVQRRWLKLLESGDESDLTLYLGPQKEVLKVHSLVLKVACPKLIETLQLLPDKEALSDIQPKIFKMFIKHLYVGESGAESIDEALQLLQIAKIFGVQDLIDKCETFVKRRLVDENVFQVFEQARRFSHQELVKFCLKYIAKNAARVLKLEAFLELKPESFSEIMEMDDDLQLENGLCRFYYVTKWCEAECKRYGLSPQETFDLIKQYIDIYHGWGKNWFIENFHPTQKKPCNEY